MPETTQISGENNQGVIAGRDVYLGDQYVVQDTLYFEPSLQEVEPPEYPSPRNAQHLVQLLLQRRLLVLAGAGLEEKGRIARHIAWLLRQRGGEVRVREWYRSADSQKIETAFHESDSTLLLLPQIQPHHLGYRVDEILQFLRARRHYAIITTDHTVAQWRVEELVADDLAWCELSWETYYGLDLLTDLLLQKLASVAEYLPEGLLPDGLQSEGQLVPGLLLLEAAAGLKKPDRIEPFIRWLLNQEPPVNRGRVLSHLELLDGERRMMENWYHGLERRDQILTIGLLFFDGLPDDQVFAALESLVSEAWRPADPLLSQFDYQDLDRLSAFFNLVDAGADGARIEMSSRQKRRDLLQAVWKLQRRKVLATLPALTAMIKRSSREAKVFREGEPTEEEVEPASPRRRGRGAGKPRGPVPVPPKSLVKTRQEQDLYSSGRRARRFREAMIETLSEVGLLSLEAVEPFLLDLAVQGSPSIRQLVAKTLASWRSSGHSEALFKLLHKWWAQGCETELSRSWISALARNGTDPFSSIRSTVALAVGYAVQYDPPQQLAPQLQSLLEVIFRDRFPTVRTNILELTVPMAVAWHLRQLESFLRTRVEVEDDLMHAIGFGMAMAFSLEPQETWDLLGRWLGELQNEPVQTRGSSDRERWISTLALAHGYIQLEGDEGVTPKQILSRLQVILAEEDHPFVRRHALLGIGLQAIRNFDLVLPQLDSLISEVTLPDRPFLVAILRQAYLRQREQMQGGDARLEVAGRSYAVWAFSERPLTRLEELLFDWVEAGDSVARQIAVQTFAALNASELERAERNLDLRPEAPPGDRVLPVWKPRRLRRLGPLGYMSTFLAAPGDPGTRAALKPLLAEVIEMSRRSSTPVGYIELQPQEDPDKLQQEDGPVVEPARSPTLSGLGWLLSTPLTLFPILSVIPDSWKLLRRWAAFPVKEVRDLTAALKRATLVYQWRWPIVVVMALLLAESYVLTNDLVVNLAYWSQRVSYESWVELSTRWLAERMVEGESSVSLDTVPGTWQWWLGRPHE